MTHPIQDTGEKCGTVGIWMPRDMRGVAGTIGDIAFQALDQGLRHRGQDTGGIAVVTRREYRIERGEGPVQRALPGRGRNLGNGLIAIGHVRYGSTSRTGRLIDAAQPVDAASDGKFVITGHNGNFTLEERLARRYGLSPGDFASDTGVWNAAALKELIKQGALVPALLTLLRETLTSFSLVITDGGELAGTRDPYGSHPLTLGRWRKAGGWIMASDNKALEAVGAEYVEEVRPGTIAVIRGDGALETVRYAPEASPLQGCLFEYLTFTRDEHIFNGDHIGECRQDWGKQLAIDMPSPTRSLVIPQLNVAGSIAKALARAQGLDCERVFDRPDDVIGDRVIRPELVAGRPVTVVVSALVPAPRVKLWCDNLRAEGAQRIDIRVIAPPVSHACHYGITIPNQPLAEGVASALGADSLLFPALEAAVSCMRPQAPEDICTGCVTGKPLMEIPEIPMPLQ